MTLSFTSDPNLNPDPNPSPSMNKNSNWIITNFVILSGGGGVVFGGGFLQKIPGFSVETKETCVYKNFYESAVKSESQGK